MILQCLILGVQGVSAIKNRSNAHSRLHTLRCDRRCALGVSIGSPSQGVGRLTHLTPQGVRSGVHVRCAGQTRINAHSRLIATPDTPDTPPEETSGEWGSL